MQAIPAAKLVLGIPAYGRLMQSPGQAETYADLFFKYGPLSKEQDTAGGFYFNGAGCLDRLMLSAALFTNLELIRVPLSRAGNCAG